MTAAAAAAAAADSVRHGWLSLLNDPSATADTAGTAATATAAAAAGPRRTSHCTKDAAAPMATAAQCTPRSSSATFYSWVNNVSL